MYARTYRVGFVLVALVAALAVNARVYAQANAADGFIGKWQLDRSQSTFSGAVPERRSMTFEKVGNMLQHTTETMQGEVVYKIAYKFLVDGKDYPADVAMSVSTVAFKKTDATTLERTGKYMGTLGETVTYKLSADGKSFTLDQEATQNGANITSHQVFVKQ